MKTKRFATLLLSICLAAQLNFCSADKNYDEEITLPIGTNFDLEMEEITRYEYDGNYVKAQTVNGKEQFILQKTGDTIITVVLEEKGQKTEMKVLVHIVTEQQFNGTPTATAPTTTTKPAAKTSTAPPKTAPATTKPTATAPAKAPAPVQPAAPAKTAAPTTAPVATAKAPESAKQETSPATAAPQPVKPAATTPVEKPATTTTTPVEPPKAATARYGTTITRSQAPAANNSIEATKFKVNQNAFDVLDLVNAERTKNGLKPLVMVKDLYDAAETRSKEISKRFTHTRPDNTRYFTVYTNLGTCQEENIAAGQPTAAAVVKAWLSMPTSRNNILNPNYTEMGVGYFEPIAANYSCYWVQLFRG